MEHHTSIESPEQQLELSDEERISLAQHFSALQMRNNAYKNIQYVRGLENRKRALIALVQYEKKYGSLERVPEILVNADKSLYEHALIESAIRDGDVYLADWHAAHTPDDAVRSESYAEICKAFFSEAVFGWMKNWTDFYPNERTLLTLGAELIPLISSAKLKIKAIIDGAKMGASIQNTEMREELFRSLLAALQVIPTAQVRNTGIRAMAETTLFLESPERAWAFIKEHISDRKERELFLPAVVRCHAEQNESEKAYEVAISIRDPLIRTHAFCALAHGYQIPDGMRQKALNQAADALWEAKRLGVHNTDEYDKAKGTYILANSLNDWDLLEKDLSDIESSLERDRIRTEISTRALRSDGDPNAAYQIAQFISDPALAAEALGRIIEYHIENGDHGQAKRIADSAGMPHIRTRLWMKVAHIGAEHFRNCGHVYHQLETYIGTLQSTNDRHGLMAEYIESILRSAGAYHEQSNEILASLPQEKLINIILSRFDGDNADSARMAFCALTEEGRELLVRRALALSRSSRTAFKRFIADGQSFLAEE